MIYQLFVEDIDSRNFDASGNEANISSPTSGIVLPTNITYKFYIKKKTKIMILYLKIV